MVDHFFYRGSEVDYLIFVQREFVVSICPATEAMQARPS